LEAQGEGEERQALSGLFSSQALLGPEVCWGLCEHAQAPRALPREEEAVRNAVPARQQAFRSGRAAARSAAQELAPQLTEDFELLVGEHRQPRWPNAIIGSIAHGPRCSIAAVASRITHRSVGIDIERGRAVTRELWPVTFTPRERAELAALDESYGTEAACQRATLLFSAKEAVFKLQYPLTSRFVDFQDCEVELEPEENKEQGTFVAQLLDSLLSPLHEGPLRGRFALLPDIVLTAIELRRSRSTHAKRGTKR
jgi:4'-phosphopantetheinyl transferase EntD